MIRNRRFENTALRYRSRAHICITKSNYRNFFVWEKTTRKELQPFELTSKIATEFAHNGASRGLHKEHYCRIDIISELKWI